MRIKYFEDTDTVLVSFSDVIVSETKEINENMYTDFDSEGNVVSLTIEHARKTAKMPEFAFDIV